MRNFRLLTKDEIECRISQVSKNRDGTIKGVTVLLYKTARTDYQLLDETVGMDRWQNQYAVIDGKMYCGIGIKFDAEWIWKWNCGTESYSEAEKGQASDAMKRAGFCWGIGTELYSAPFIYIPYELLQRTSEDKVFDRFYVKSIDYDDNEDISALQITNDSGAVVFTHPRKKTEQKQPDLRAEADKIKAKPKTNICIDCGAEVPDNVRDFSMKKWGKCYCFSCQKKYAGR